MNPDWLACDLDIKAKKLQGLVSLKDNQITRDACEVATAYRMLRAEIIAQQLAELSDVNQLKTAVGLLATYKLICEQSKFLPCEYVDLLDKVRKFLSEK